MGIAGQIEDAPSGYPRYAALLSTNSSFYVYRRFLRLRARLLLYKQDSLITLEEELDQIDRNEPKVLFLGNQRRDKNNERKIVMKMIEHGLTDYDALVKSTKEALKTDHAKDRDVTNLRNWLENTGVISRNEREYLTNEEDLMTLSALSADGALHYFEMLVEDFIKWSSKWTGGFDKISIRSKVSRDEKIFILSGAWLDVVGRLLIVCLLGAAIVGPVVIVDSIHHLIARSIATYIGTTFFIGLLSFATKAKTAKMFLAGATYATVLTVFMSGNNCNCQK